MVVLVEHKSTPEPLLAFQTLQYWLRAGIALLRAVARYVLDVHEKLDIEALARWVVHPSAGEAFMRLHES